jgi:hypothetical protein
MSYLEQTLALDFQRMSGNQSNLGFYHYDVFTQADFSPRHEQHLDYFLPGLKNNQQLTADDYLKELIGSSKCGMMQLNTCDI